MIMILIILGVLFHGVGYIKTYRRLRREFNPEELEKFYLLMSHLTQGSALCVFLIILILEILR